MMMCFPIETGDEISPVPESIHCWADWHERLIGQLLEIDRLHCYQGEGIELGL